MHNNEALAIGLMNHGGSIYASSTYELFNSKHVETVIGWISHHKNPQLLTEVLSRYDKKLDPNIEEFIRCTISCLLANTKSRTQFCKQLIKADIFNGVIQ